MIKIGHEGNIFPHFSIYQDPPFLQRVIDGAVVFSIFFGACRFILKEKKKKLRNAAGQCCVANKKPASNQHQREKINPVSAKKQNHYQFTSANVWKNDRYQHDQLLQKSFSLITIPIILSTKDRRFRTTGFIVGAAHPTNPYLLCVAFA